MTLHFKTLLTALFIGSFSFSSLAQSDSATAATESGIYSLSFRMSDQLREEFKVTNTSRNVLNSMSSMEAFPEALKDSIRTITEQMLKAKLGKEVKCVYKQNKKGKNIETVGVNGTLGGMPVNTFGNALSQNDLEQYITVSATFNTGGTSIDFGHEKRSKIKPALTVVVKVVGKDKKTIYSNKITMKDFGKLRAVTKRKGDIEVKESETLTPTDFFEMYKLALTNLLAEEN